MLGLQVISLRPSRPPAYINSNMYRRAPFRSMFLFQRWLHHYLGPTHLHVHAQTDKLLIGRLWCNVRSVNSFDPRCLAKTRSLPTRTETVSLKEGRQEVSPSVPARACDRGSRMGHTVFESRLEYRMRFVSGSVRRISVAPCGNYDYPCPHSFIRKLG
jgi:hypothetical protein